MAVTAAGVPFAFTLSVPFDVTVGESYSLDILPYLGHVHGGTPFQIQPTVRITDRGGNVVSDVDEGMIEATLTRQPRGGAAELLPVDARTTSFSGGTATFVGLYINKAGGPYQIEFKTNLVRLNIRPA